MEIFTAQCSESAAVVHFRAPHEISGIIRGPFCAHARTLPTNYPIPGDGCVTIVDPCYWTPKLPFRYRVSLESGGDQQQFDWCLRRLETHRSDLRLDGRRYVIRGISTHPTVADCWSELRDTSTALWLNASDVALMREASEYGVFCLVRVPSATENVIRELELHSAVQVIVVDRSDLPLPMRTDLKTAVIYEADAKVSAHADIHVVVEQDLPRAIQSGVGPILAMRSPFDGPIAAQRMGCDRLQRDLAPQGQFAGYLCGCPQGRDENG